MHKSNKSLRGIYYLSWNHCTPCHILQAPLINGFSEYSHQTPGNEVTKREEKIPWQRKTSALGEEEPEGNHLHVKSCTPLELLIYPCRHTAIHISFAKLKPGGASPEKKINTWIIFRTLRFNYYLLIFKLHLHAKLRRKHDHKLSREDDAWLQVRRRELFYAGGKNIASKRRTKKVGIYGERGQWDLFAMIPIPCTVRMP